MRKRRVAFRVLISTGLLIALGMAAAIVLGSVNWTPAPPAPKPVGALFVDEAGITVQAPFCTATVVPSPRGDVLLTAAHCLSNLPTGTIKFVPYYRNDTEPFGSWTVVRQILPPGYPHYGGTVNRDFAFLIVNGNVQRRVGAIKIGSSPPLPPKATLVGYNLSGGPLVCTRPLRSIHVAGAEQMQFDCPGYSDGASGAPYITHGRVVGVLGGYESGGYSPDISYSSPFGKQIQQLYREATK